MIHEEVLDDAFTVDVLKLIERSSSIGRLDLPAELRFNCSRYIVRKLAVTNNLEHDRGAYARQQRC